MKYKIFISYSAIDRLIAYSIGNELKRCGAEVFLGTLEIGFRENIEQEILDNLLSCNELWVLVNPTRQVLKMNQAISDIVPGSLNSAYVWLETGVAWARNIPIVPILVGISASSFIENEDIPLFLKRKQLIEWQDNYQRDALLNSISLKVKRKRISYKRALLYIEAEGEVEALDVSNYLEALNDAYNRICYFNYLETFRFKDIEEYLRYFMHIDSLEADYERFLKEDFGSNLNAKHEYEWSTKLIIREVHLSSPGFWSFLGALNPLEVLRNLLNDQHERRKDRKYREQAEARKLELENRLLEVSYLDKLLNLPPNRNIPAEKLNKIVEPFIRKSLLTLEEYQDRKLLGKAQVKLISDDPPSL